MSVNGRMIEKSNIHNYLPIVSDSYVMLKNLKPPAGYEEPGSAAAIANKAENEANYALDNLTSEVLTNLFHSITNRVMTSEEIINSIYTISNQVAKEKFANESDENRKKIAEGMIEHIADYFKIVHQDYNINDGEKDIPLSQTSFCIPKEKAVFDDNDKKFKFTSQFGLLSHKINKSKEYEVSSSVKGKDNLADQVFKINEIVEYKFNESLDRQDKGARGSINEKGEVDFDEFLNVVDKDNKLVINKSKTSLSFMMLNNPKVRAGTKNSLELSNYLQNLSTIEMSKCYPYIDVKFLLPGTVKTKSSKIYKTASITNYLQGSAVSNSSNLKSEVYRVLEASYAKKTIKEGNEFYTNGVETNFAAFTMPQTAVNFDESYVGHWETHLDPNSPNANNSIKTELYKRNNSVHDYTKPFLTVKSFNVDIAPTAGLMSFKTGRLSLVLHDKTRMADIAPFIKPDLFGSFGAEIAIRYGWSHMDAIVDFDENAITKDVNYFAQFLENNKLYEKYIITNSSYSIDANGQVNIDLSIAMKGPVEIRAITFETDAPTAISTALIESQGEDVKKRAEKFGKDNTVNIQLHVIQNFVNNLVSEANQNKDKRSKNKLASAADANAIVNQHLLNIKNASTNKKKASLIIQALSELGITVYYKTKSKRSVETEAEEGGTESPKASGKETTTTTTTGGIVNSTGKTSPIIEAEIADDPDDFDDFIDFWIKLRSLPSNVLSKIGKGRKQLSQTIDGLLKKFTDGVSVEDPFFDKENYYDVESVNNIDGKIPDDREYKISIAGINEGENSDKKLTNYVSLGNIVTAVIGSHLAYTASFDEIQIISYTLNDYAGLAKNKNIASLLIDKKDLEKFLTQLFINGAQYTLESLLMQIVKKFITTRYCVNYGLNDLYKLDENNNVKANMDKNEKSSHFQKRVDDKIRKIHNYHIKKYGINSNQVIPRIKFVMPKIKMLFDTMTKDRGDITILRISMIDQHDNPFESTSSIMRSIQERGIDSAIYDINSRYIDLKTQNKEGKDIKSLEKQFIKENNKVIQTLLNEGILNKSDDGTITLGDVSSLSKTIKNQIKKIMPSVTYGTSNSAVLEASISTINEAKLNTVFLTRPDRNSAPVRSRVKFQQDLPLRILPSQVNVTIFGCPFVNYAQYLFLDFETNTTIDNQYVITGIKHDITPGKFTTTLTLSYGDAYGKYENIVDTLNRTLEQTATGTIRNTKSSSTGLPYSSSGKTKTYFDLSPALSTIKNSPRYGLSNEALKVLGYAGDDSFKNLEADEKKISNKEDKEITIKKVSYRITNDSTIADDTAFYEFANVKSGDELNYNVTFDIVVNDENKSPTKDFFIDLSTKFNQNIVTGKNYKEILSTSANGIKKSTWSNICNDENNKKAIDDLQTFLLTEFIKIKHNSQGENNDTKDISVDYVNCSTILTSFVNVKEQVDNPILDTVSELVSKINAVPGANYEPDGRGYKYPTPQGSKFDYTRIIFNYQSKKKRKVNGKLVKTKFNFIISLDSIKNNS